MSDLTLKSTAMKTSKIFFTFLLIVMIAGLNNYSAAQGDSCTSAIAVAVAQNISGAAYSFNGNDVWLKFNPDSSDADFYFFPDSISDSLKIGSIDVYSGSDCSQLHPYWSWNDQGADSSGAHSMIHFPLPGSATAYYLDVKKNPGNVSGFRLQVNYSPSGACTPNCPDLIRNGDFNNFNAGCVNSANNFPCPQPFNNGCVCGWRASHGTPNLNPPFNYATMGCVNTWGLNFGEGIYQPLQTAVLTGRHYLLSFSYQNTGGATGYSYDLHAQCTNANLNAGTNCFELAPNSGWDVPNTPVHATSANTVVNRCFTPNADYGGICFFPEPHSSYNEWVSVDNISLEPLDVPLTNQHILCAGSAALCVPCPSSNPAVHYLWSTGETTTCILVSPAVTTGYNLTVSVVENGNTICSFVQIVTVFVHAPGPIAMSSGSTTLCNYPSVDTYCFNSINATSYNFAVNPPNAFTVNGNCITVNWNNVPQSCATIDVMASTTFCSKNTTFQICIACQGNPSDLTFCDVLASDVLNNPIYASYITGGNIFTVPPGFWAAIHGTFTIDVPFVFNHSDVRLDKDAKIVVNNNQSFEVVNQCHLHSCDGVNMWDGIYVNDISGIVHIHDSNNLIEDAKNAVVSNNGGQFIINSTTFNNNYIGVLVNAYLPTHPGKIYGCTFTGTGSLLKPYSQYCSLKFPLCGVQLNQVGGIQIGEPLYYSSYGRNIFQELMSGIYAVSSSFNVFTSEFHNMVNPVHHCVTPQGCGIFAKGIAGTGCRVNVGDASAIGQCIFDQCPFAIVESENCYGQILSNSFTHCISGIMNINCSKYNNLVKGNSFEDFKRGIYFFNAINQLHYGLEIYDNLFNTGMTSFSPVSYGNQAINVSNAVSSATNLWVTGNTINYSRVGVFARNVWEPCQIRNNTISFDILPQDALTIGVHHGIECENDNGLEIDNNLISWRNQPAAPPSGLINFMNGISINYSSNTTLISGGIIDNKIGPYPAANSGTTYGMGSGINISSNCLGLTLQCNKMNRCEEGITMNGALLGSQGYLDIHSAWYSNGNTFSYTPAQGGVFRIGGSALQLLNWAHIGGIEDPVPCQVINLHPILTTFSFYHCQLPFLAEEVKRDEEFGNLIEESIPDMNPDYSGYEDQIRYITQEKFYATAMKDSTLINTGTPEDAAYSQLYAELDNSIISKMQEVKTLVDSLNYPEAMQKLLVLADSNQMEHNKKIAMQVYMETFASGNEMDSIHRSMLEPISNLHPLIGGESVFWACAMLDKDVNNILPQLRKAGPHGYPESVWKDKPFIFPNPANDMIYVNSGLDHEVTLFITDLPGQIILQKRLLPNSDAVNVESLKAGIYSIQLADGNRVLLNSLLTIIK
jgi:hypothetical protein